MMVKMNPTLRIYARSRRSRLPILSAVVPDRFDRATFHRFFAKIFFFGRLGLLVNERVATVVVAFEIRGRSLAAQIAVDALLVDVEFAGGVFGILVGDVSHVFSSLREREVRWERAGCKSKAERFARIAGELE